MREEKRNMYDMKITTTGKSIAPTRSNPIDIYLEEKDVERIYEVWGQGVTKFGWEYPISMRGGVFSITVEMVHKIPVEQLEKIYYPKRTKRIVDALASAA